MGEQLGWSAWQTLGIYIVAPLLIAIVVIWRAVYRATTHPDMRKLGKRSEEGRRPRQRVETPSRSPQDEQKT